MPNQKFTIFLIPDTHGYQAIIPHYPEAITSGDTPEEALALLLEDETDPIPPNIHASHTITGGIELDLPDPLLEEVHLHSKDLETR